MATLNRLRGGGAGRVVVIHRAAIDDCKHCPTGSGRSRSRGRVFLLPTVMGSGRGRGHFHLVANRCEGANCCSSPGGCRTITFEHCSTGSGRSLGRSRVVLLPTVMGSGRGRGHYQPVAKRRGEKCRALGNARRVYVVKQSTTEDSTTALSYELARWSTQLVRMN